MKANALSYFAVFSLTTVLEGGAFAQTTVNLESGPVITGRNDVRIPGDGGTLFSLKNDLEAETKPYVRVRISHTFNEAHTLSLLYAPLRIESEGNIDQDVLYNGINFESGTPLTGTYKFNSYRLTYRYNFVREPTLVFGLGVTAKIRDANIILASADESVERTSFGLVPLPNFYIWWKYLGDLGLLFEGDAYAGPGGRAIDVQIAATYEPIDGLNLRLGYRILEGGADNERVYGFALFHYAAVGATYSF
ncbi:MAG: hypothetical protein VYC39_16625 [Myxococcota bacterium]|nr:hypothetical protein [Myxococcota bacterium]